MKRILVGCLILLCSCAFTKQRLDWKKFEDKTGWTKEDVELESVAMVLHGIDWCQTLKIARNPDEYYEKNPLIGKHPSKGNVNTYFILSGVAKIVLTHYLPRDYNINLFEHNIHTKPKRWFQYLQIGVSGYNVGRNYSIGLRFGF